MSLTKITLYPEQEVVIERMMSEPTQSILLAHEMDKGKTVTAIEFALRMKFKTVLFVGIRDTWEQFHLRAMAQSDNTTPIRNINATKAGKLAEADLLWGKPGWYFIGQQLFNSRDWKNVEGRRLRLKTWENIDLDLLVYDEVHMAAGYGTNGQKTLHNVHPRWKIAMSGTFYANKFHNAWAPAFWLWPDLIDTSYYIWCQKWVENEPVLTKGGTQLLTPRGQSLKKMGQPIPESEKITVAKGEIPPEGRFVASLPCYIRHTGDPVPKPTVIEVDLLPEQRRMYESLENNLLVYVKSRPYIVEYPVTLRDRLRTATLGSFDFEDVFDKKKQEWKQEIFFPADTSSTKLDALFAELAKFPDDRVIFGTHSKKFAKIVVQRMAERGLNVVEWDGDVSAAGRQAIKDRWLSDDGLQYIVTVFKSFATGLDWAQHNCWRMGVLSEQVGDGTAMGQWVRRVFRTGPNKEKFEWFTIHARNTYDSGEFENRELQQYSQAQTLRTQA